MVAKKSKVSVRGKAQTAINFTERQRKFFDEECSRCGISVSELVRRIVDTHIDSIEKQEWMSARAKEQGLTG
jgi:hypothetical protein